MPSVNDNYEGWEKKYNWEKLGDEWSEEWGGTDLMWRHCVKPRIQKHLQSKSILEIAPGHGRWTQYLKEYAEELHIVDLADKCIEFCKQRFKHNTNIFYYVNDGYSLTQIKDKSIDFVFSFDSLVHADLDSLESYLKELDRILTPKGTAFIHHSNLAQYKGTLRYNFYSKITNSRIVNKFNFLEPLRRNTLLNSWRSKNVDYKIINSICKQNNLNCDIQEVINWASPTFLKDCLTTISRDTNQHTQLIINKDFMKHADLIKGFAVYQT